MLLKGTSQSLFNIKKLRRPQRKAGKGYKMAEFTPIETQEAFDAMVKDRLARQEKQIREQYGDYDALKKESDSWKSKEEGYQKTIADNKAAMEEINGKLREANGKLEEYRAEALKTKIAIDKGLPFEAKDFLKGTTEDEIKASAEQLSKFTVSKGAPPLAHPELDPPEGDGKNKNNEAYKTMLRGIKGE